LGVRLRDDLAKEGRRLLDAQDFEKAAEHLQKALGKLPNDSQLVALSNEANVQRHRVAAQRAFDQGDPSAAVDELMAARALLDGRSNASWTGPLRQAVDALAERVRDAICDQAQKLSGERQYEEALEHLAVASRLSSTDPKVVNLRQQIEALSVDPKTANLSGTWQALPGLRALDGTQLAPQITQFVLTERGAEITVTAVQLPELIRDFSGQWRRDGARLVGTFDFVLWDQIAFRAAVTANVKSPRTLSVEWKEIRYTDVKRKTFELHGNLDWTRLE
jgi:tetratricopeptide (TPR) repeat protein